MRQVFMNAPGDVTVGERQDPEIIDPTDAVIRLSATCICGSDLWPYRGVEDVDHTPMGHEYLGVVEEIGSEVETLKPGDFVVGSFVISDGTCKICRAGYPSRCRQNHRDPPRTLRCYTPCSGSFLVAFSQSRLPIRSCE
jgi:threonine dehydrogenase-like Zn-dependent dehydrogenase